MTSADDARTAARPGLGRSVGTIGIALLASSALGYVLLVLVGRLLHPSEYGVFLVYWGVVFGFAAALAPVEQEVARQSAHARASGQRSPAAAPQVVLVGAAIVTACASVVLLPGPRHALFDGSWLLALLVVLAAPTAAVLFGVRGLLIGHDRVLPYAWLVVSEAVIRIAALAALAVVGVTLLGPLGVAVALGFLPWVAFPRAFRLVRWASGREPWARLGRRMLALVFASGLTATVITGYPAVVALLGPPGDDARLGALFAALTLARVPLLLVSPLQALAVPAVVRLTATDPDGVRRLRRLVIGGLLGFLAAGAVGGGFGWWLGQPVIGLLYGDQYVVEPWAVAGLVWSSVMLAAILLLAAVLVAQQRYRMVTLTWAVVAAASALVLLLWTGDAVTAAVVGLVTGPTAGLVLAGALVLRRRPAAAGPQ